MASGWILLAPTCWWSLVSSPTASCFPQKAHAGTHSESKQGVWTGGACGAVLYGLDQLQCRSGQNKVFEARGVNVRMEVTGRYCDRVQGLMEITTGDKLTQVIQDTSIRLNFGISQVSSLICVESVYVHMNLRNACIQKVHGGTNARIIKHMFA